MICACGCGETPKTPGSKFAWGHYNRGRPSPLRGRTFPNRVSGEYVAEGYVRIRLPDHPRSDSTGYLSQHIVVAEEMLGRPLRKGEVVHHKNEIKHDNRPENLQVMTKGEHSSLHRQMEYERRMAI